jgi:hypothetical protein
MMYYSRVYAVTMRQVPGTAEIKTDKSIDLLALPYKVINVLILLVLWMQKC